MYSARTQPRAAADRPSRSLRSRFGRRLSADVGRLNVAVARHRFVGRI